MMDLRSAEIVVMLLAGLAGLWAASRRARNDATARLLAALVPMGAMVVLVHLVERLAKAPDLDVNASRVANAIAVAKGFNIFVGMKDGPLLDYMYGPVFALAYTPAALASSPTGAIWTGVVLSFLFVVAPLAWMALRDRGQPSRLLALAVVVCLGLACTWDKAFTWVTWYILADPPALALAAVACACVAGRRGEMTTGRMVAAAVPAVLAVWAKQIAAPIVLALPVYVALAEGWRRGLRFALVVGVTGLVASSLFVLWFGLDGLVFNMFQMPGHHPWKGSQVGRGPAAEFLRSLGSLAREAGPSGLVVVAVAGLTWSRAGTFRQWLVAEPWTCLACVALFMVPTSTMGGAKIGGEANVYAMSTYFLTCAALLGLARVAGDSSRAVASRASRILLSALLIAGVGGELFASDRSAGFQEAVHRLRDWRSNPQEQALAFALAHRDEVHFISNPLIGLYSDGQLYSDMFGRYDRELAGYRPAPEQMRAHAPSRLRYVVVRRDFPWFARPALYPEYAEFTELVPEEALPYHFVWQRASALPAATSPDGSTARTNPLTRR